MGIVTAEGDGVVNATRTAVQFTLFTVVLNMGSPVPTPSPPRAGRKSTSVDHSGARFGYRRCGQLQPGWRRFRAEPCTQFGCPRLTNLAA